MVIVTKTADDNVAQSFVLPNTLSGTGYVRVVDTDSTQGNKALDTVYVDEMYIRSDDAPAPPRSMAPPFRPLKSPQFTGDLLNMYCQGRNRRCISVLWVSS